MGHHPVVALQRLRKSGRQIVSGELDARIPPAGLCQQCVAAVDTGRDRTDLPEFLGQPAVPAADIQDIQPGDVSQLLPEESGKPLEETVGGTADLVDVTGGRRVPESKISCAAGLHRAF